MLKKIILVAGPTASGKTDKAIELALQHNTSIISADSRQCYKEMSIGVARPLPEQLQAAPHHFIATHSIHDNVDAAVFESYALNILEELFQLHDVVIVAGGTGLYINALLYGIDPMPPIPKELREQLNAEYESKGLQWLQEEIQTRDPGFYKVGEIQNPHRMLRALEFKLHTGHSILDYRTGEKKVRNFEVEKVFMDVERSVLHDRINRRVDSMMRAGLLDEVKSLIAFKTLPALQTVGYQELFEYLEGKISLHEAVEKIKSATRQYAKRQETWIRKYLK